MRKMRQKMIPRDLLQGWFRYHFNSKKNRSLRNSPVHKWLHGNRNTESGAAARPLSRAVLNEEKKEEVFLYPGFPKMPTGTPCVGGWRLATGR